MQNANTWSGLWIIPRASALGALALALAMPAHAQTRAEVSAQQAAALFLQSCVAYTANMPGLRAWAASVGLRPVPEQGQAAFLKGAEGKVFDASGEMGKYVLMSHDDGGCVVLAQSAEPGAIVRATEAVLRDAAITVLLDGDREDLETQGMRHRTYHASQGARSWTLVISTGPGRGGVPGQAMLSAGKR